MTSEIEDVMPAARELVEEVGRIPGKDLLKSRLRIGYPKAGLVKARLEEEALLGPLPEAPVSPAPPSAPPGPSQVEEEEKEEEGAFVTPSPRRKGIVRWPVIGILLPAYVAIWGGWVDLGRMTGFGPVRILPGINDNVEMNLAITLPIGLEVYASYGLYVWLHQAASPALKKYARTSALISLVLGAAGQIAYHLLEAAGFQHAPWWVTVLVACIPVGVLGMAGALVHMIMREEARDE